MELLQQHRAPDLLELVVGVGRAVPHRSGGGPQLGLPQQVLAAAVALLGARLGGVGAAVVFEVELADPGGRVGVLVAGGGEERFWVGQHHARRPLEVRGAVRGRDHLAGGSPATVAVPERDQRGVGPALLGELVGGPRELGRRQVGVVGVDGREVGEHPAAVDPFPPEGVVRDAVGVVPGQLLCEEVLAAGQARHLRECAGVPEGVGKPDVGGLYAQLLDEEPLALDELPHQRLGADHVGVRLHPHAAHGDEPALLDPGAQPLEELGVAVLDPGVLLRRRARERDLVVRVHEGQHVGDRARHLALRLPHRPQPRGVDVRVTHGVQHVRAGRRLRRQRGC